MKQPETSRRRLLQLLASARLLPLATLAGAGSSGLHAVDEIDGWTCIMGNFQHAGDWGKIHNIVKPALDALVRADYRDNFGAAAAYLTADLAQTRLSSGWAPQAR